MNSTGKERDAESGNDYFGARYYASSMGRFMSPDPSQLYYSDQTNPQSFNLYSYAQNNPLINTDPSGEECVWDDGSYDAADDKDTGSADKCSGQGGTWIDPNLFENALLTNGKNANIQYGSWSGQANSTIASSWLGASSTTSAPNDSPITLNIPMNVWIWAAQQTTPNHGPWTYGNWAGPGGRGAPVNNADAGAMMHDYCYAANGHLTAGANFGANNGALQACNQALCDTEKGVMTSITASVNQPGYHFADSASEPDLFQQQQAETAEYSAASQIVDYFTLIPFHGNGCH